MLTFFMIHFLSNQDQIDRIINRKNDDGEVYLQYSDFTRFEDKDDILVTGNDVQDIVFELENSVSSEDLYLVSVDISSDEMSSILNSISRGDYIRSLKVKIFSYRKIESKYNKNKDIEYAI